MITISESKEKKEDRSLWEKPMKDLLESEGWKLVLERLSMLRAEAVYHIMAVDVESVKWRQRVRAFDEVIEIPDLIMAEAKESKRLQGEQYAER